MPSAPVIRSRGSRLSDEERLAVSVLRRALALLVTLVVALILLDVWSNSVPTTARIEVGRVSSAASGASALVITSQQEISYAP
jgi:hypothetical protein